MSFIKLAFMSLTALICVELSIAKGRLDALEFNGELKMGHTIRLSFYDPTSAGAFWVELGDSRKEFELVDYDSENRIATVRLGDRERSIELRSARIISINRPKPLSAERLAKIHDSQLQDIYGNEQLLKARMEVVVAREEKEAERKMRAR
ncbi:hypothetical protein [Pelagicoccus albus]|uniref:Uncharacterized protein n=1 Tax=Pelagicoccus albus TaxID=415222 RepID=A0A7X1E824_9BACT|nr:hypothetical protein [Pelagicoccus albus]MBC2605884.1 hypothetical protein [Pelagicoccus albus]